MSHNLSARLNRPCQKVWERTENWEEEKRERKRIYARERIKRIRANPEEHKKNLLKYNEWREKKKLERQKADKERLSKLNRPTREEGVVNLNTLQSLTAEKFVVAGNAILSGKSTYVTSRGHHLGAQL